MNKRSNEIVQLVQNPVNDFYEQMTLLRRQRIYETKSNCHSFDIDLIFQSGRHEKRKDLIEQRTGAKFPRLVRHLTQGTLNKAKNLYMISLYKIDPRRSLFSLEESRSLSSREAS